MLEAIASAPRPRSRSRTPRGRAAAHAAKAARSAAPGGGRVELRGGGVEAVVRPAPAPAGGGRGSLRPAARGGCRGGARLPRGRSEPLVVEAVGRCRAGVAVEHAQQLDRGVVDRGGLGRRWSARSGTPASARASPWPAPASPSRQRERALRRASSSARRSPQDADLDVAEARRRGAVGDVRRLPGLALAAVSSPHSRHAGALATASSEPQNCGVTPA